MHALSTWLLIRVAAAAGNKEIGARPAHGCAGESPNADVAGRGQGQLTQILGEILRSGIWKLTRAYARKSVSLHSHMRYLRACPHHVY